MDYASAPGPDSPGSGTPSNTAASRYENLVAERQPYLDRARECSMYTIPSLVPPAGTSGGTMLYQPYQSVGADGVNNLAAKLLMVLFPPGAPFFRLTLDDFVVEELAANADKGQDPRGEFEAALGKIERAVTNRMEQKGTRKHHFEALLHLVVAGNGLLQVLKDGSEKFYPLDRYVVCRDLDGNVTEILTKECLAKDALPPEIREVVDRHTKITEDKTDQGEAEVYTWVQRKNGQWLVHQEVCGEIVPASRGSYPLDKSAFIPLRWTKIAGESYGRGRCEEYLGDLRSLEAYTKSLVDFSKASSKILALVDESGVTNKEEVARAESGDVISGNAKDVTFLRVEKMADFQVTKTALEEVKSRLERAFQMASSIQRQAERVTAEEIRVMAGELEQGLGGNYSVFGEEFQRPLVARYMHIMSQGPKKGRIPKLPDGVVAPKIITGLDGLGRNTDMQRLDALIAGAAETFGPQVVAQWVNVGGYLARRGAALGIDLNGIVKTQQEVDQQQQAATMRDMAGKLGPNMVKAVSDHAMADKQAAQAQQPATAPTQQ